MKALIPELSAGKQGTTGNRLPVIKVFIRLMLIINFMKLGLTKPTPSVAIGCHACYTQLLSGCLYRRVCHGLVGFEGENEAKGVNGFIP